MSGTHIKGLPAADPALPRSLFPGVHPIFLRSRPPAHTSFSHGSGPGRLTDAIKKQTSIVPDSEERNDAASVQKLLATAATVNLNCSPYVRFEAGAQAPAWIYFPAFVAAVTPILRPL